MRTQSILLSVITLLAISTAPSAQTFDERPVTSELLYSSMSTDWSGFYAGVHGGHIGATWDGLLYSTSFVASPEYGFDPSNVTFDADGWLGGIQVGLNQHFENVVVGVELDSSWMGLEEARSFVNIPESHRWDITNRMDWLSTARMRLGVSFDGVLVYGTAGLAVAQTTSDLEVVWLNAQGGPAPSASGSASENHIGFAVGAGAEWRVTQDLSVKGEYLYADLGSADYNLHGTLAGGAPHTSDAFPADLTVHTVRFGLNYRFDAY